MLNDRQKIDLDNYITGHWGEDQFKNDEPEPDDKSLEKVRIFESREERDAFIEDKFPQRRCLDVPGYYALPDGRSLSVVGDAVRYQEANDTIDSLSLEYAAWNKAEGLNIGSADEHLEDESLTDKQRQWLADFSERWQQAALADHLDWYEEAGDWPKRQAENDEKPLTDDDRTFELPCTCDANADSVDTCQRHTDRKAPTYADSFDANEQITAEEQIATAIYEAVENSEDSSGNPDWTLTEEDCADLGRHILKQVLQQFRPDLFNK